MPGITAEASKANLTADPLFRELKDYLIRSTGLAFYQDRDAELAAILSVRLAARGCSTCGQYLDLLFRTAIDTNSEMDLLIGQITVGETYFFRHPELFDALRQSILPGIIDRNQGSRRLRIWSAGCANGAEPYSIALLLAREFGHLLKDWDVLIVGTDINRESLLQATQGRFAEWAFRSTPAGIKSSCFTEDGRNWTILPQFKKWVSFQYHNLVEDPFRRPMEHIDVILCRNVTIYFDMPTTRRVIREFHSCLAEDGWLLVGHAEPNPENFHCFRAVDSPGVTSYQKRNNRAPQEEADTVQWDAPLFEAPPVAPIQALPTVPRTAPCHGVPITGAELDRVRQFANRGDGRGTLDYCQDLMARDQANPILHFYRALAFEMLGSHAESAQSLRKAIDLDDGFILAQYHLGQALRREKNGNRAAHYFQNVLRLLTHLSEDSQFAEGDGMTAGELRRLTETHLQPAAGEETWARKKSRSC